MDSEKQLVEKYQPVGVLRGGDLLLRQSDALDFIEDCRELGLTILGMDFWIQRGNEFIQTLGSADYSDLSEEPDAVELTTREAQELIGKGLPDNADWVSFVVEEGRNNQSVPR